MNKTLIHSRRLYINCSENISAWTATVRGMTTLALCTKGVPMTATPKVGTVYVTLSIMARGVSKSAQWDITDITVDSP